MFNIGLLTTLRFRLLLIMISNSLLSLAILAAPALANYGNDQCKAGYNVAGACLAVASACKSDCSSFLHATVTPCPSTHTKTAVTTVIHPASTTTVAASITNVDTVTDTVTSVITATADEMATATETINVFNTDDVPATVTATVVTTATAVTVSATTDVTPVTVTITARGVEDTLRKRGKRGASSIKSLPPQITTAADIEARAMANKASVCKPTTAHPTHLPADAKGCHDAAQYSSACSCAGVKASTKTLSAHTTTVTITSTVDVTPTVTATSTMTDIDVVTATVIDYTTVTLTTTDVTVTVPQTNEFTVTDTLTTTASVTDTIIPAPVTVTLTETPTVTATVTPAPTCNTYNFVAIGGAYDGEFLVGGQPDPSTISYGYLTFTPDVASTSPFYLRSSGQVYENNQYGLVSNGNDLYYVLDMTDASEQSYGIPYLYCSISAGGTSVANAVGTLTCNYNGGTPAFYTCPAQGNDLLQSLSGSSAQSADCSEIQLAAIFLGTADC